MRHGCFRDSRKYLVLAGALFFLAVVARAEDAEDAQMRSLLQEQGRQIKALQEKIGKYQATQAKGGPAAADMVVDSAS